MTGMKEERKNKGNVPNLRFPEFEGEWEVKKLGEILKVGSGRDYKHLKEGNIPVFGTGGYMTSVNEFLFDGESVCIGRKGTINKPFYYNGKFWTVDTLFYTYSYKNVLPKFVFNVFEQINWLMYNEASGVPSLSKSTIEQIEISIPDISEQQKIASFLSLIDERIAAQSKIIEGLKELKAWLSKQLFSRKLRFKDENGNDFPEWVETKLGEIAETYSGGTPTSTNNSYYIGNIPFIKSGEISSDKTEQFINEEALKNSSAKMVSKGDLLLALYGATSGEVAISQIAGAINQAVLVIKSMQNTNFLHHFLRCNKENIISTYLQGGQGNLSAQIVKNITINLPSLTEQKKIADFLSEIDNKVEVETTTFDLLTKQKHYLLRQMFI